MPKHSVLLDAFGEARGTWDDLVSLQPDVIAGSDQLKDSDLGELERRVQAHQAAIAMLADALETEPSDRAADRVQERKEVRSGISNRESAQEEARERQQHPPLDASSPPPQDAAGRVGEDTSGDTGDRQMSHKAGRRLIAQRAAESRDPDESTPSPGKVAGAFGRER